MLYLFALSLLILAVLLFLQQPMFGKRPAGKRLELVKNSSNYRDGQFQNLHLTPNLTEGVSMYAVMKEFFFEKNEHRKPADKMPSQKTDLLNLPSDKDVLIWFGHSSYFIQLDGKKILVDPVLSGAASPIKATTRSFNGSDVYTAAEIPAIDYLFISHDHWDHLDYDTIISLKPRIGKVICGLGVGQHFERWDFAADQVMERDWGSEINLEDGFKVTITPARHFSGRGLKRNISLWISFVLTTPSMKIFLGGDSGYDTHFKAIGDLYGPFDLAILECGQYDKSWKYIHMLPDQIVQAAQDLRAAQLMPVHWGKFSLANHAWDDPIKNVSAISKTKDQSLATPMIGESVNLRKLEGFTEWWTNVR